MTAPRYMVVTRTGSEREGLAVDYFIVDTQADSNGEGRVLCEGTAADAHLVVSSLNLLAEIHPQPKAADR